MPQPASNPHVDTEETAAPEPRGRGRPKLGVVAREVTLLPRHWEWLGAQPGGASVALRKLVDAARRANGDPDRSRAARDAAYHFMSAMAGNLPGFEEASRALFADDRRRFAALIAGWPGDIRDHIVKLAFSDRRLTVDRVMWQRSALLRNDKDHIRTAREIDMRETAVSLADPQFLFDFGSPNAFLSHEAIPAIEARIGVKFEYVPVLLGGIFKATNNRSPGETLAGVKNKREFNALETEAS